MTPRPIKNRWELGNLTLSFFVVVVVQHCVINLMFQQLKNECDHLKDREKYASNTECKDAKETCQLTFSVAVKHLSVRFLQDFRSYFIVFNSWWSNRKTSHLRGHVYKETLSLAFTGTSMLSLKYRIHISPPSPPAIIWPFIHYSTHNTWCSYHCLLP